MKPFNLEEYLKNPSRKVVTRDGRKARIICTDKKSEAGFSIVALIDNGKDELLETYTKEGYTYGTSYDLFFALEKHEGWVNIFKNMSGGYVPGSNIYDKKEDAEAGSSGLCVATVKIEWEE